MFIGTACIICGAESMKCYSVCLSQYGPTAANPLLQVCCCVPDEQVTSIDCCVWWANVGSATLLAYVGGWTQTCYYCYCVCECSYRSAGEDAAPGPRPAYHRRAGAGSPVHAAVCRPSRWADLAALRRIVWGTELGNWLVERSVSRVLSVCYVECNQLAIFVNRTWGLFHFGCL